MVLRGKLLTALFHEVFGGVEKVFAFSHSLSLYRGQLTSATQPHVNEKKKHPKLISDGDVFSNNIKVYRKLLTYLVKIGNVVVGFQVLTAVSMKFRVFWDVAPCSHVEVDRRFRGAYCLHHQGDEW
jgi:hypothetical protein